MKGGSKASDLVMETANPKLCDTQTQVVNVGPPVAGDVKQLSLYRTTGGGNKKKRNNKRNSKRNKNKNKKSNRKRRSKSRSNRRKRNYRSYKYRGGSVASNNVMSSNPKMCMDSQMPVNMMNPYQAQPANVNLYQTTGGGKGCYSKHHPHADISDNCQNGGGQGYYGKHPNDPSKLDSCQNGGGQGCYGKHPNDPSKLDSCQNGGGSDWRSTVYSRGPVNVPTMNENQFRMFNQTSEFMPNESLRMAKFVGGAKRKNKKSKKKSKKKKINLIRSDRGPMTRSYNLRGGGSDWRSTVYSRGPVNVPTMNEQQFRAFNQSSQYIPNQSLRMGAFI